jgi:hypothetical protein
LRGRVIEPKPLAQYIGSIVLVDRVALIHGDSSANHVAHFADQRIANSGNPADDADHQNGDQQNPLEG